MSPADFQNRRWSRAHVFALQPNSLRPSLLLLAAAVALAALGLSSLIPGDELRTGVLLLSLGPGSLGAIAWWHWKQRAETGFIEFRPAGLALGKNGLHPHVLNWEQIYFARLHLMDSQVHKLEIRLHDGSSRFIHASDEAAVRTLAGLVDPGPETLAWIDGQLAAGRPFSEVVRAAGLPDVGLID